MFELIYVGLMLFGGMILLPLLYLLYLCIEWLVLRMVHKYCRKQRLAFEKEVRSHANHNREAS